MMRASFLRFDFVSKRTTFGIFILSRSEYDVIRSMENCRGSLVSSSVYSRGIGGMASRSGARGVHYSWLRIV